MLVLQSLCKNEFWSWAGLGCGRGHGWVIFPAPLTRTAASFAWCGNRVWIPAETLLVRVFWEQNPSSSCRTHKPQQSQPWPKFVPLQEHWQFQNVLCCWVTAPVTNAGPALPFPPGHSPLSVLGPQHWNYRTWELWEAPKSSSVSLAVTKLWKVSPMASFSL